VERIYLAEGRVECQATDEIIWWRICWLCERLSACDHINNLLILVRLPLTSYKLTPWRITNTEKLSVAQLVKKFPACEGSPLRSSRLLAQIPGDTNLFHFITPCTSEWDILPSISTCLQLSQLFPFTFCVHLSLVWCVLHSLQLRPTLISSFWRYLVESTD
jgi:hypothetical protein